MRTVPVLQVRFAVVVLVAVVISLSSVKRASAVKFWRDGVINGSWNTATNWSSISAADTTTSGVPGNEPINIVHTTGTAHTVTLNVNATTSSLLSIDLTGAGTTVDTLSMTTGNNLTAGAIFVGGHNGTATTAGRGAMTQSAGTASTGPGGDWVVGHGAGSTGTYTLSGGAVVATQSEFIGFSGTGVFNHSAGTNTINAGAIGSFNVGANAGGTGTYNLSGTGQLISNKTEIIGASGTGNFNQTGGSNTIQGAGHHLNIGDGTNSFGTYSLSAGSLSVSGDEFVGGSAAGNANQAGGRFLQSGGTHFVAGTTWIGFLSGSFQQTGGSFQSNSDVLLGTGLQGGGTLAVSGAGTTFTNAGKLVVGESFESGGVLTISGGGSVLTTGAGGGEVAPDEDANGFVTITGPGSVWQITNDLKVGALATIDIQNQGFLDVGDELNINNTFAKINLTGGRLRVNSITGLGGVSRVNFLSGTIQLRGNRTLGGPTGDALVTALFGVLPMITSGKNLTVDQNATLGTAVIVDGGVFTVGQLVNGSLLQFKRGTINVTNQSIEISSIGPLGSTLDLAADMTVNSSVGILNQGLVTGDGQIGGNFANDVTGEIRAEPGKSLKLTGASNVSVGQINLLGGMLDMTGTLANNTGAFVSGNGTIKTSGLNNSGTMNFSGLANVLGDVTNNLTGKIISSGGGPTTFFDDVVNNGEIRTSAGSRTVFFGATSGGGTYTGLGTVNFEGDLKPGNSPATMLFGGNVTFGAAATLEIELAGTIPGSGYDQVKVAGQLSLGGALNVLLTGLTPAAGQSFDILDWGSLTGTFASVNLPTLVGLAWNTSQLYTSGILSITSSVGVAGDYNNNGTVDAADYVLWRNGGPLQNDATPGVQPADYDVWRAHFGQSSGNGAASLAHVPEPSAFLLTFAAVSATLFARSRNLTSAALRASK